MRFFTLNRVTFLNIHRLAPSSRTRFSATKAHATVLLFFSFCLAISAFSLVHATLSNQDPLQETLDMPLEYGEVIYRMNARSPRQLYIIGISHRDPNSGANGATTVQAQMEIFRIGEWLKKNMHLNLLLPEGYFNNRITGSSSLPSTGREIGNFDLSDLDNALLQEKLTSGAPFKNAEMLLMEHHNFHASQVENRHVYDAVRSSLGKLSAAKVQPSGSADSIAELQFLQEFRTAQLLQSIPAVIENEFISGAIGNRSALFTIGLNHIKDIVRYIQNEGINITSPTVPNIQPDLEKNRLNLLESGYGITIIIPRTLADNRTLLKMTDIGRILPVEGKYQKIALLN